MLSPEQIQAIAKQQGDTVAAPAPSGANPEDVKSRLAEFDRLTGSPGSAEPAPAEEPGIAEKIAGGGMDMINSAADKTMGQYGEAGKKIVRSITEGADKLGKGGKFADVEAGLGAASGAVQGVFAPITGIIQSIAEKASDSKHVQDFAAGNKTAGGILDLYDQLTAKIDEISKAHPEEAKNIGDAANVLLATLGGETGAGTADIGEAASATAKASGEAAQGAKEAIQGAGEGAADIAKTAGEKVASAGETISKQVPLTAKSIFSKIYRLTPETSDFFLKHPEYANHESLSTANVYNLSKKVEGEIQKVREKVSTPEQLGTEVKDAVIKRKQLIKENAMKYPTGSLSPAGTEKGLVHVDKNWLADQLQNKDVAGVKIHDNGQIEHGDAYSKINPVNSPTGARRLQDLWDTYGPEFAKGQMSRAMFIKLRQDLAELADYKGGVDTVLKKTADKMRENLNKEYRKQIPGLEKLDATHTKMSRELERLSKGITVEDPATGQVSLQEGATSRIMNATKDTKSETAKQLEELVPGITKKVEQAKQFEDEWRSIVDERGNLREDALKNIKNSVNSERDIRLAKLENLMPGITEELKLIHAADEYHNAMKGLPGAYVGAAGISQIFTGNPVLGLLTAVATQPNVGLKILKLIGENTKH